jgi:hypothetical protein
MTLWVYPDGRVTPALKPPGANEQATPVMALCGPTTPVLGHALDRLWRVPEAEVSVR